MPAPSRAELIEDSISQVTCPWCAAAPHQFCVTESKAGKKRTELRPWGRTHQARDKAGMKLFHEKYGVKL